MNTNLTLVAYCVGYDDENQFLSKCEDVELEAKRVLLNEELDKMAIVPFNVKKSRENVNKCLQQLKDSLNSNNCIGDNVLNENEIHPERCIISEKNKISYTSLDMFNKYLMKKYFKLWNKQTIKTKNQTDTLLDTQQDKDAKLDRLIKMIKKCKKQESANNPEKHTEMTKQIKSPNHYKHRFNAQKNIIDMQKVKLQEQTKVIEELKLGIMREDLIRSLNNTKTNIREIFSNCSEKVKCKVPILLIDENKKFSISSQKAPKIVQHMEQRAIQRLQNRQIILERKRLIEEARQKMLEEAIEKKRTLEEEERKKNLEAIKERRKKELESDKIRQEQKEKYMRTLNKAIQFHNKKLLQNYFNILCSYFIECKENDLRARKHYENKILNRCIFALWGCVEQKYVVKYNLADAHFAYKILKRTVKIWHEYYMENIRNMQVAEDICDFHLTSRMFVHWNRYACTQIVLRDKRMKVAENHYKRKILLQYYYQWRSLPAVLQLEKAKELKKQKWREKVWEVLPDYRPPDDI